MSLQADEDEHSIEMHLPYLAKVINKLSTYIDLLSIRLKLIVHLDAWPEEGGGAIRDDG